MLSSMAGAEGRMWKAREAASRATLRSQVATDAQAPACSRAASFLARFLAYFLAFLAAPGAAPLLPSRRSTGCSAAETRVAEAWAGDSAATGRAIIDDVGEGACSLDVLEAGRK